MIKFCSECGTKVEYKFSPPKFCSNCGAPMGVAHVNESKPIDRNVNSTRKIKAIADDETDAEFVPEISKLEYEIDTFGSNIIQNIGSLAGKTPPTRKKNNTKRIEDL